MIELGERLSSEPALQAAVIATHEKRRAADQQGIDWRTIDNSFTVAAIHGGGMACAGAIGVWELLEEVKLAKYFNAVTGLSGSGGTMSAILSGKLPDAKRMFTRTLAGKDFINFTKPLRGQPPVDLGLLRRKLEDELDVDGIYDNEARFGFGTTVLDTFTPQLHTNDNLPRAEYLDTLVAGMVMPRLAGKAKIHSVTEEGRIVQRRVGDGGLAWESTEALAVNLAAHYAKDGEVEGKKVEVLGISCHPASEPTVYEDFTRSTARWVHRAGGSNVKSAVWNHAFAQADHLRELATGEHAGARVDIIHLEDVKGLAGVVSRKQTVLDRTVIAGWNGACATLGLPEYKQTYPGVERQPLPIMKFFGSLGGFTLKQAIRYVP